MGTRNLTIIKNEEGQEILVMYRQYDGFFDGHGQELPVKFKGTPKEYLEVFLPSYLKKCEDNEA